MKSEATSEQMEGATPAVAFESQDTLLQVLKNEIGMLDSVRTIAEGHRDAEKSNTAEYVWFDAWVLRLKDLIEQARNWVTVLESGTTLDKSEAKEELVAEKGILAGLIGLTNIAIMTGIKDEETDELIRYYRKDFWKTRDNIRNLLKTEVWS